MNLYRFLIYRNKVMMAFLANVTYTITFVLGVKFVFDELGEVGGYTAEIFIAYMIMMQLWWSIHTVLVRKNMQFLAKAINKGQLDFYLLKPVSLRKSLPVISVRFVDIIIIIFDLCAMVLLVDFSQFDYADMLLSVFFLGVGVAITYFFVSVIVNMTFWIGRNDFFTLLIGELAEIVQVPAVFFPPVLKILFTFFVPALLFAGPAVEALYGDYDAYLFVSSFVVLAIFVVLSEITWRRGLKAYTSAN